jgi:hypothetical protein
MPAIEIPTLINWIIAGLIGLVFGTASAFFTYRFERRRDDLKWQRELEKLRIEFELQALQQQKEHEQEQIAETGKRINAELTRGLDDPEKAVRSLSVLYSLVGDSFRGAMMYVDPLNSILNSIRSRRRRLSGLAVFAGLVLGVIIAILAYGLLAGLHVSG